MSAGNDPSVSSAGKPSTLASASGTIGSGSEGTSTHRAEPPRTTTLAELQGTVWEQHAGRSVKDEIRQNLVNALRTGAPLFRGVLGYQDTVVPAVVNALLSRHNFILLGLRGQAKTRILRQLTTLLDEYVPYIAGTELHDDPFAPLTFEGRQIVAECGGATRVDWLHRSARYVEKLATPDTTVADIIGDIDPIKAARLGTNLGDERAVHYGLLPRANRGIFAMNELPDLSGKVQVALFNIMQEGDVQIKGYPLRIPLDVMLVFSANPEDYTARGKIITPLKDRIGSEIRTHYPSTLEEGMRITWQEAWTARSDDTYVPPYVIEAVEEVAFQARDDSRVDKHSGVSQRLPISLLENVVSNAERRALVQGAVGPVARVSDLYQALPAVTGKIELEYEGELKGAEHVAREIVRRAVGQVFSRHGADVLADDIVEYFESDNNLRIADGCSAAELLGAADQVPGLVSAAKKLAEADHPELVAAAAEFVLEGLHARRLIGRSEERGYVAAEPEAPRGATRRWN